MIRTHLLPCTLPNATCDALNLHSGRIYSGIISRHWLPSPPRAGGVKALHTCATIHLLQFVQT
jgi:hypothetical protein